MRYKKEPIIRTIYLNIRRMYYITFKRKYINEQIKNRKGICRKHGCCRTRIIKCPYMIDKTNECSLWKVCGYEGLPYVCKISPFDEKDKTLFCKKYCDFHWDKN